MEGVPAVRAIEGESVILASRSARASGGGGNVTGATVLPGITLAFTRQAAGATDLALELEGIAATLNYSAFFVERMSGTGPAFGVDPAPAQSVVALSAGLPNPTNPVGGILFWSGAVVGFDTSATETHGHAVVGEAEVSIPDLHDPKATVAFSSLVDIELGVKRDSIVWTDLAVNEGAFASGEDGDRIEGRFYGAGHEEVGGQFERQGLTGAFGAASERASPPSETLWTGFLSLSDSLLGSLPGEDGAPADEWPSPPGLEDAVPPPYGHGMSRPRISRHERRGSLFESERFWADLASIGSWWSQGSSSSDSPGGGTPESVPPGGDGSNLEDLPTAGPVAASFRSTSSRTANGASLSVTELSVGPGTEEDAIPLGVSWSATSGTIASGWIASLNASLDLGVSDDLPLPPAFELSYLTAGGFVTLRNPLAGSGSWKGLMTGVRTSDGPTSGNRVRGSAELAIANFEDPAVDVTFTDIIDTRTGLALGDIFWSDLPVSHGAFRADEDSGEIEGLFVGQTGDGVVGSYRSEDLRGLFSAARTVASDADQGRGRVRRLSRRTGGSSLQALIRVADESSGDLAAITAGLLENGLSGPPGPSGWAGRSEASHRSGGTAVSVSGMRGAVRGGDGLSFEGFGGWLRTGYFAIVEIAEQTEAGATAPLVSAAVSYGQLSGSNPPAGTAAWSGAMVGIDLSDGATAGNSVRGNVLLTVTGLSYAVVNIQITAVADIDARQSRSDMAWWGIPLVNGAFEAATDTDQIRGHFLGKDHRSASGAFLWHAVLGAFGASQARP